MKTERRTTSRFLLFLNRVLGRTLRFFGYPPVLSERSETEISLLIHTALPRIGSEFVPTLGLITSLNCKFSSNVSVGDPPGQNLR